MEVLEKAFPLAGNSAATLRFVKDPQSLSELCAEIGIQHPEIRFSAPESMDGWLNKLGGGAGGSHVRHAGQHQLAQGQYLQRFVAGQSVSALFVADGRRAKIVGFSRQWTSPSSTSPFRYGGAVRLARFPKGKRTRIAAWLDKLTRRTGLLGLCSADFIDAEDGLHLIEINPRPGATIDIFDTDEAPLLTQHLRAVRGQSVPQPTYRGAVASAIAYAAHPIDRFPEIDWPEMTADHQSPGTTLQLDDPICTVLARARSAAGAERAVKHRIKDLAKHWKGEFQ
ncbi:ATP-grasp domain-containing protein [Sinorhizobium sp. BG8]|uniref:ATP-grasp domain-containing protein n=1 Tax=Sinorhizobium sp. BG8 TaxID=2613773 RepID=UPI001FEE5C4C|nr:ATP-grasp domain-containing protein [Sinorhizobium sp. BG8]